MADIVTFLTTKNMGAYAPIFKKNKVDGVKFLSMEEDDLKSLGVGVSGASRS